MLQAERQDIILEKLATHGSVRTIELAKALGVADETIRRDLENLEKQQLLERTHGGAIKLQKERVELPHDARKVIHLSEKKAIASKAIELIQPRDCIFLDASSTALQIALKLHEFPMTVITNSHLVIAALSAKPEIKLIATGGEYDHSSHSYVGPGALPTLQHNRVDKVFCSGNGISASHGISEINEWQATIKRIVIEHAKELIYLADTSKIGQVSAHLFGSLISVDTLITNAHAPSEELEAISDAGLKILYA